MLCSVLGLSGPAGHAAPSQADPSIIDVRGFARVIDGDSIEITHEGHRLPIGLIGIVAAPGNTTCGEKAAGRLSELLAGGFRLEADGQTPPDSLGRLRYYATTRNGQSVERELVRGGLALPDGNGKLRRQLAEDLASAREARAGCIGERPAQLAKIPPPPPKKPDADPPVSSTGAADPRFFTEIVASGFTNPTGFAELPDGRFLVAEKNGLVRLVQNGVVQPTPVLDIRSQVNDYWDRGLNGITIDPSFTTNGYIYLHYVYENDPLAYQGAKTVRVSRFAMSGDVISTSSELAIVGSVTGAGCPSDTTPDCVPIHNPSHAGGGVRFGADGSLFVSLGDGAGWTSSDPRALRSYNLDSLSGKLLRISRDGQAVSGNPFHTGNAGDNRSKVWNSGLRNPFRFGIKPGSGPGIPIIGDVGWDTWEEINVGVAGRNFGWPCYEGAGPAVNSSSVPECNPTVLPPSSVSPPVLAVSHAGQTSAVIGGTIYTGTAFPPEFQGAYFYGNYATNVIDYITFNADNSLATGPGHFIYEEGPVDIQVAADGSLLYLSIVGKTLRRVVYNGPSSVSCPDGQYRADYFPNPNLTGLPTLSRCELTIYQNWLDGGPAPGFPVNNFSARWIGMVNFAPGTYTFTTRTDDGVRFVVDGRTLINDWYASPAGSRTATHTFPTAGQYEIRLEFVEYGGHANASVSWELTTANAVPTATIIEPTALTTFRANDTVTFEGSATDAEDGDIPNTKLTWEVIIHHCPGGACHTHPFISRSGVSSGTFLFPDHDDDSHLELVLTATDNAGLQGRASRLLQPRLAAVSLASSPSGLQLNYGSKTVTAPFTTNILVGASRTIGASSPQGYYAYSGWSDGGAQQHDLVIPSEASTYTASFVATAPIPPTVTTISPADGAGGVAVSGAVSATFSAAMNPATLTSSTFTLTRQGSTSAVSANVTYDAATRVARLQPGSSLTTTSTYTARIKGGSSGAKDQAGTALENDRVWSFTTGGPPDTTAPQISNLRVTNITPTSVTITWSTNEPADSQVLFGRSKSLGSSTARDSSLVAQHSVTVTGLSQSTRYYYRAVSRDAAANTTTSSRQSFTTTSSNPSPPKDE